MSGIHRWRRVRRDFPCPICERPDWCLLAVDGSAAICTRTESLQRCGEAGWLHRLRDNGWRPSRRGVRSIPLGTAAPRPDLADMAAAYRAALDPTRLAALARSLGLTADALTACGIGWAGAHRAWSFPMVDASGAVLGIRLRRSNGDKFSVRGSRDGLFLPAIGHAGAAALLVCEGPTDTSALLDLGYTSIAGRPSCTGGIKLVVDLVQRRQPGEVVILADGDEPGRRGADNLASVLLAYCPMVRVVFPQHHKDVREFVRSGGSRRQLDEAIALAPTRRLAVRAVAVGRATQ